MKLKRTKTKQTDFEKLRMSIPGKKLEKFHKSAENVLISETNADLKPKSAVRGQNMSSNCSQCLICLRNTESSLNSEGQPGHDDQLLERQLSVIYLVTKLLDIPSEVCANYLSNFGNPEQWICICADCSSFVDEGRQLFNQIQALRQRHKALGHKIRLKMNVKRQPVILGQATAEIRNYLDILGAFDEDDELSEGPMALVDETLSHVDTHFEVDLPERGETKLETETLRLLPKRSATKKAKYVKKEEQVEIKVEPSDVDEDDLDFDCNLSDSDYSHNSEPEPEVEASKGKKRKRRSKNDEKLFRCEHCPRSYHYKQQLKAHARVHESMTEEELAAEQLSFDQVLKKHEELVSKAEELGQVQGSKPASLAHLCLIHKVEEFPCTVCGKICKTFSAWDKHYNGKSARSTTACGRKGDRVKVKVKKRRERTSKDPHRIDLIDEVECGQCGASVPRVDAYAIENHMRAEHLDPEALKCKGCSKSYPAVTSYRIHYYKAAATDPSSPCALAGLKCGMASCPGSVRSSPEALALHQKLAHLDPRPGPRPPSYKCLLCSALFVFKSSLNKHISSAHTSNCFPCPKAGCSKTFRRQQAVAVHLQTYHAAREGAQRNFQCDVCPSSFYSRNKLVRHLKIHNPENPFVCEVCGKGFKDKNYLTIHSWQHDPAMRHKYKEYRDNKLAKARRLELEAEHEQLNS